MAFREPSGPILDRFWAILAPKRGSKRVPKPDQKPSKKNIKIDTKFGSDPGCHGMKWS